MERRSGGAPGGRAEVLCLPCSSMSGNRSSSARGRCDLLRSWCDGRTALPAELPEHGALRAGLEPAPCRFGVDNGDVAGPQQMRKVAVVGCSRVSGVEPHGADRSATAARGNRAASARDDLREGKPARVRTRTREVGARDASGYTTGLRGGRPGSNGTLRSGAPALCLLSYIRVSTPGWNRTSVLRLRRAALFR